MPRPKKTNLTPTEYRAEFNKANYERLEVVVPKGQKATIKAHAQSKGESVNGLIQRVVLADMGLSEWPTIAQPDALPELDPLGDLEGNNDSWAE